MNKVKISRFITGVVTVVAIASMALAGWSKIFTPATQSGLWLQVNNSAYETIVNTGTEWILTAGGRAESTHYARLRYPLPENGKLLTEFYVRAEIKLEPNFCNKLTSGVRFINTDNYNATYNGTRVGASGGNELRASVEMWTDKTIRIRIEHQNNQIRDLYVSTPCPAYFAPGVYHTVELYGNVATVSPWYFRVDGNIIAQGVDIMANDSVPLAERVITRLVAGLDGAWAQDTTPISVSIRSLTFADYDMNGGVPVVTSTPSQIPTSTFTPIASFTPTRTPTLTPTRTPTIPPAISPTPTALCVQALNVWVCDKKP